MGWWTQNEAYGSFSNQWERTYLTQLPSKVKNLEQDSQRIKLNKSSSEYGNFYKSGTYIPRHGSQVPALPPINPNVKTTNHNTPKPTTNTNNSHTQTHHSPAEISAKAYAADDTVPRSSPTSFPLDSIENVDIQVTTKNDGVVSLYSLGGQYKHTSFPNGIHTLRLPDVKDVTLIFRRKGEESTRLHTRPV